MKEGREGGGGFIKQEAAAASRSSAVCSSKCELEDKQRADRAAALRAAERGRVGSGFICFLFFFFCTTVMYFHAVLV